MSTYPMTMRLVDLDDALRLRDLSDPADGPHALQLVVEALEAALGAAWPSRIRRCTGRRVVTLADNYDNLGYGPDAVTRDARYTRYVDPERVLRSHSSAMIPAALRSLSAEDAAGQAPADVLLSCPGICYRRDSVDWQHSGTPHQMDLWRLVCTGERAERDGSGAVAGRVACTETDLLAMIGHVVEAVLPGWEWRAVPTVHPYTMAGRQIDVRLKETWVEIGECGLAASTVLERAGLDPVRWSGLAMGLGLDRLVMLRKGIPDIRLLRSADPRVAVQMRDLSPYRPVSHMPPVRRDLSIVVDMATDASDEAVGDRVREALGGDADAVESAQVVAVTGYDDLPAPAQERLAIQPGQVNVLVRLVLRALDRSLTDLEANRMRDRVYAVLHEGDRHEWTARR
jgi:phenylalanyl-tRNA synthetase alpha chain